MHMEIFGGSPPRDVVSSTTKSWVMATLKHNRTSKTMHVEIRKGPLFLAADAWKMV